eukprot:5146164-Pleurochrysis_carterae.AAC.2
MIAGVCDCIGRYKRALLPVRGYVLRARTSQLQFSSFNGNIHCVVMRLSMPIHMISRTRSQQHGRNICVCERATRFAQTAPCARQPLALVCDGAQVLKHA